MARQPSKPSFNDEEPSTDGGGNGAARTNPLGYEIPKCDLGNDCPYAGSMRWLHDERLRREQVQGEISSTVDRLADKLQTIHLLVDRFERDLKDLRFDLDKHRKSHRWFELSILAIAAAFGGFLAKGLEHGWIVKVLESWFG
jgi:hypothetical protein